MRELAGDGAERRIAAAVAAGRIAPARADFWRQRAKAGEDITVLDTVAAVPDDGTVAAAGLSASSDDAYYQSIYPGTVEAARKAHDARVDAAHAAIGGLSDEELFDRLFGTGGSR